MAELNEVITTKTPGRQAARREGKGMATTMLSSDLRGRLRAALGQLPDEDVERLGFKRGSRPGRSQPTCSRAVPEGGAAPRARRRRGPGRQERSALAEAEKALAAAQKERSDDPLGPWPTGVGSDEGRLGEEASGRGARGGRQEHQAGTCVAVPGAARVGACSACRTAPRPIAGGSRAGHRGPPASSPRPGK